MSVSADDPGDPGAALPPAGAGEGQNTTACLWDLWPYWSDAVMATSCWSIWSHEINVNMNPEGETLWPCRDVLYIFYFRSTSSAITSAIDTSAVWRGRCRSIWWLTTETGTSRTARTSSGRQGTTWIRWARWHAVTGASPGRRWYRLMTTRIEPLGSGERCRSGAHGFRGGFLRSRQHVSDTRARTKWPPLGSCMCRLADGHTIRTRRLVVA